MGHFIPLSALEMNTVPSIPVVNMVKQQLRTCEVLCPKVLALFETLPREKFVPKDYADFAYSDMQIPLAHGQRMFTPTEEGKLLQALDFQGTERVLEVGTGTGFLTACLAKLAKEVVSVDYYQDFTDLARQNLAAFQFSNILLHTGDAFNGWMPDAPYDVIIFSGALRKVTEAQSIQLSNAGKIFAIVGEGAVMNAVLLSKNNELTWQDKLIFETEIPALINVHKKPEFVF